MTNRSIDFQKCKLILESAGVLFEPGLSIKEIHQIEDRFQLLFPLDYRDFIMYALPVSEGFVSWRSADESEILKMLSWPSEGICFDIEFNRFWIEEWGPRPEQLKDAISIARKFIDKAPLLIPILAHRYIPAEPNESGNPVFSVYQTDIIYFGRDFNEYLENEFG